MAALTPALVVREDVLGAMDVLIIAQQIVPDAMVGVMLPVEADVKAVLEIAGGSANRLVNHLVRVLVLQLVIIVLVDAWALVTVVQVAKTVKEVVLLARRVVTMAAAIVVVMAVGQAVVDALEAAADVLGLAPVAALIVHAFN